MNLLQPLMNLRRDFLGRKLRDHFTLSLGRVSDYRERGEIKGGGSCRRRQIQKIKVLRDACMTTYLEAHAQREPRDWETRIHVPGSVKPLPT